jgi:hypothetical protein
MATRFDDYMNELPEDEREAIRKEAAEMLADMEIRKAATVDVQDFCGYVRIESSSELVSVEVGSDPVTLRLVLTHEEACKIGAAMLAAVVSPNNVREPR